MNRSEQKKSNRSAVHSIDKLDKHCRKSVLVAIMELCSNMQEHTKLELVFDYNPIKVIMSIRSIACLQWPVTIFYRLVDIAAVALN